MTPQSPKTDALSAFFDLPEDKLAEYLANDPAFFKKAQKAIAEAKRRQDESKRKEALAPVLGADVPKLYAKAARLVELPFNDINHKAMDELISQGLVLDWAPPQSSSLLKMSLDYLATKERVELRWPHYLTLKGATARVPEIVSLVKLYSRRDPSSLGLPQSMDLPGLLLCQNGPWKEAETELLAGSHKLNTDFTLAQFLYTSVSGSYSSEGFGLREWQALSQLILSGCSMPATPQTDYRRETFWQKTSNLETKPRSAKCVTEELKELRASALVERQKTFQNLGKKDWVTHSIVNLTDNLEPVLPHSTTKLYSGQQNHIESTPSRAFAAGGTLDESFFPIFCDLCDWEETHAQDTKFDALGRSRLYFINERLRAFRDSPKSLPAHLLLLSAAQECLARGDSPASVNSQNFSAKAADSSMVEILNSWHEKLGMASVLSAAQSSDGPANEIKRPKTAL